MTSKGAELRPAKQQQTRGLQSMHHIFVTVMLYALSLYSMESFAPSALPSLEAS